MNRGVEFLLTGAHSATHDLFESRCPQLGSKLVTFLRCRQGGDQTIQKIQVCGKVIGCIPFDAANIWSSGDWRARWREISLEVGAIIHRALVRERIVRLRVGFGEWNHIEVMKEDPEDFFGHICYLLAPDSIWSGLVYIGNEGDWLTLIFWRRISQVCKDSLSTCGWQLVRVVRGELGKQEVDDNTPSGELARALLFLVKEHLQQSREEFCFDAS
jgi:hypothetical protein